LIAHPLTEHFTLYEFTRNSHGLVLEPTPTNIANMVTVALRLEHIRAYYGSPIRVTSGFRNPALNALIGGHPQSYHLAGLAADFKVIGVDSRTVAHRAAVDKALHFDQIIYYADSIGGHIHIQMRTDYTNNRRELLYCQPTQRGKTYVRII
jgi:zinc D-Ala-D-Ala carboxypeptidase